MFGRVAHRYDLANHLLSFNIDRLLAAAHGRAGARGAGAAGRGALDICCGTGDLVLALERGARRARSGAAISAIPCWWRRGRRSRGRAVRSRLFEADALALPLADGSLDLITVAFGFRNLANYEAGLRGDAARAASGRDGGHPGIFAAAQSRFRGAVQFLFAADSAGDRRAALGVDGCVSRICRNRCGSFPPRRNWRQMMRRAGFGAVEFERLTGGIVALHRGRA